MPIQHCKGNLSFISTSEEISKKVKEWSWKGDRNHAPRCWQDIGATHQFAQLVSDIYVDANNTVVARCAFPCAARIEAQIESGFAGTIDSVDDPGEAEEPLQRGREHALAAEEEMLQEIPLQVCHKARQPDVENG